MYKISNNLSQVNSSKNSWVLSIKNKKNIKYQHHCFCTCSTNFMFETDIHEPESANILCPVCGNDYFKDADIFKNIKSTRIWKYFAWMTLVRDDNNYWKVILQYEVPIYDVKTDMVTLKTDNLLKIIFRKDGSLLPKIHYQSKIVQKYSLFLNDTIQSFQKLLLNDAKLNLYKFILFKKQEYRNLLTSRTHDTLSLNDKLKCVKKVQMLDFILHLHKAKSVKKALYRSYQASISKIGDYPYSDYTFSRSIKNIDLLIQLYGIDPENKKHFFTDETFSVGIEFILFLQQYYSEKQIVRFFVENMKEYQHIQNWRDTLYMLQTPNAFISLKKYFSKVKLTTEKLHNEVVRVFHIVSYELDAKEKFEYNKIHLSACMIYKGLEFRLPSTVQELSAWSKILHNCMFGYRKKIHQQQSIIFGVFKTEELIYAIELKDFKIVQAKAIFNTVVPLKDMNIINSWKSDIIGNFEQSRI